MTREQFEKLQREKGFYNFVVKRRFVIAVDIFQEFKVPLQHVIMLFSELFPQVFVQRLIEMFDVNIKDIPYYELQRQREMALFEYQFKHFTG